MSGNAISSLPPDNFTAYPDLVTLDLSDNLLPDVPILDIPQLTSLYVKKLKHYLYSFVVWSIVILYHCTHAYDDNVTLQYAGW